MLHAGLAWCATGAIVATDGSGWLPGNAWNGVVVAQFSIAHTVSSANEQFSARPPGRPAGRPQQCSSSPHPSGRCRPCRCCPAPPRSSRSRNLRRRGRSQGVAIEGSKIQAGCERTLRHVGVGVDRGSLVLVDEVSIRHRTDLPTMRIIKQMSSSLKIYFGCS